MHLVVFCYPNPMIGTNRSGPRHFPTDRIGARLRALSTALVYRKMLTLSSADIGEAERRHVADVNNLVSNDCQKFLDLLPILNLVWGKEETKTMVPDLDYDNSVPLYHIVPSRAGSDSALLHFRLSHLNRRCNGVFASDFRAVILGWYRCAMYYGISQLLPDEADREVSKEASAAD